MKNLYNKEDWEDSSYLRLGEILLESGKINLFHLSMVLDIQRFKQIPMGQIFLSMNVITEKDLEQALYIQSLMQKRAESNSND